MPLPLLFAAAAGASFLKGVAGIAGGYQQAKSLAAQKLGAEIEGKMALLRGKQIAERSREDLLTVLGNVDAIRSARGAGLDSATGEAIRRRSIKDSYRDEAVAVLGELNRSQNASMAAKGYGTASRWAVPLSVLNSAGDFAQAYSYAGMKK